MVSKIKQKIQILLAKYKENSGTIKGFDVIFEYVDFIKKEPYTANLLQEGFSYAEEQIKLLEASLPKIEDMEIPNVHKIFEMKSASEAPMHKEAIAIGLVQRENNEQASIKQIIPLALTNLVLLYKAMGRVKEQLQNKEPIEDKLNILQDLPISTLRVKVGEELFSQPFALFASSSLLTTAKYILDHIDSEELSIAKETKKEPWFEKDKSILHFLGEEIKIARQKDRPIDHYILECIFSKDDISDPADFSEISEDFLKEDYDNLKGWNKFRNACDKLNDKIETETKIKDFILYSTEKLGWCKINQKYL